MADRILVLDAGTTSTRALTFAPDGTPGPASQQPITQHYPQPGRVEHDAAEIYSRTLDCAKEAIAQAGGAERIACIGITNQRETVVAWDRGTLEPLGPAIVWQDRRTADACAALKQAGHEPAVREATGLLLDPYFSATKMRWMLDDEPAVAAAARAGTLAFGTVESWLVAKLTGGAHLTDAGNASRTLLLPLEDRGFDRGLCDLFGVPVAALPEIVDTHGGLAETAASVFARAIPITGLGGDQQAATIGQGCLSPGMVKATYGTGAFVLASTGATPRRSSGRLLTTVLHQRDGRRHYALEGSIFVAGSLIQWLRDSLGLVETAEETEALARGVEDSGGVTVVPALSGLGAPHWLPDARGIVAGLSFASGRAHVVRAALEAMAHQTRDLAEAFTADGTGWDQLAIDGGMSANDWMAQDVANLLGLPVERPDFIETTALGAAMLAAVGAGLHPDLERAAAAMRGPARRFEPDMADETRRERIERWDRAIAMVRTATV